MSNIYYHDKQIKGLEKRLFSSKSELLKEDKEDLNRFYKQLVAEGLTTGRILKILNTMNSLFKFVDKPFRNLNTEDMISLVGTIHNHKWSDWTKKDAKIILRLFYKFIKQGVGYRQNKNYPDEVSWITAKDSKKQLLPEDVLTEEDVLKIAENSSNIRDKAFVLALYESGTRIGEFLNIKMKHISFDEYGAVFRVSGKTGDRRIRIVASVPAIKSWIDKHPFKTNHEAYLWIREHSKNPNGRLQYKYVLDMLKESAQKACIVKRVNPHSFRHARATFHANRITDRQMKEFFGWSTSKMIGTYAHISGRDLDEAILKQHGITTNGNNGKSLISPTTCERCKHQNEPSAKLCEKCYMPTDIDEKKEAVQEVLLEFLMSVAETNPELKKTFRQIVKKRGLEEIFT